MFIILKYGNIICGITQGRQQYIINIQTIQYKNKSRKQIYKY